MEKVIEIHHVILAVRQLVQERRDFFSVQLIIDQKRLEAFQMNLDDVLTFCCAEILVIRFRIMRICIVDDARQVVAARVCLLARVLSGLNTIIDHVIVRPQILDDVISVKCSCQKLRTVCLGNCKVDEKQSHSAENNGSSPSFFSCDAFSSGSFTHRAIKMIKSAK